MTKRLLKVLLVGLLYFAWCGRLCCQQTIGIKKPMFYYTSSYSAGMAGIGYWASLQVKGLERQQVLQLSSMQLSVFNRKAINQNSSFANTMSDVCVGSALGLPLLLSLHKEVRKDFWGYNMVYAQAMLSTVGEVLLLKAVVKKNRPYMYNANISVEDKLSADGRFSFPSGHTAMAASACFFGATAYSIYFPKSKYKPFVWAGAVILPMVTGYLRYRAGKHFFADVAGGYLIGATNGIVFPLLFKIGK